MTEATCSLRILMVEPSGCGGVSQHAHNLANALTHLGHDVALATRIDYETKDFPCAYKPIEVFDRFTPRVCRLARFVAFARKFKPHIVHIDGAVHPGSYYAIWQFLRCAIGNGPKYVYTAQDVVSKYPKPHHPWVLRKIYQGMSHVFVNLEQNRQYIIEHYQGASDRTSTVLLGDLLAFVRDLDSSAVPPATQSGNPTALFFGFLEARKGVELLIRAFSRVREELPTARLRIAGPATEPTTAFHSAIRELGLEDAVSLEEGYVPFPEIPSLFADCDVVVLPYESGWSSGVILSAYGFGKPVIATTIGGLPELVHDGETGLLIPPGDEDALSRALVRLLGSQHVRDEMGIHVIREAKASSWERVAHETTVVYSRVLETT